MIIDLSHVIKNNITVFPGCDPVIVKQIANIEADGYNEIQLNISTHTGTHIDCPYHFNKEGFRSDSAKIQQFIGQGMTLDCRDLKDREIPESFFRQFEKEIKNSDFLIINTGWSKFWQSDKYFKDFPVLSIKAANYLSGFNLKGIGIDAISFDIIESEVLDNHILLLGGNVILIENLTNIENLPFQGFTFFCLPLKIENGDGSPVRAYAMTNS